MNFLLMGLIEGQQEDGLTTLTMILLMLLLLCFFFVFSPVKRLANVFLMKVGASLFKANPARLNPHFTRYSDSGFPGASTEARLSVSGALFLTRAF